MKGEWCIYSEKPLFCQEPYCCNCEIFQRWDDKAKRWIEKILKSLPANKDKGGLRCDI